MPINPPTAVNVIASVKNCQMMSAFLAPMARRLGVSAHAVVLAWALAQSPTVIVIPSARTVDHALDSVGAADLVLGANDLAAIDAAEFSRA